MWAKKGILALGAAVVASLSVGMSARAANLVVNGDFENSSSPQPFGWTLSGTGFETNSAGFAHGGTYGFGIDGNSAGGYITQNLATTIGTTYSISFWLDPRSTAAGNTFSLSFDGSAISPTLAVGTNLPNGYHQYTYTALTGSASTALKLTWTASSGNYMALDDVLVDVAPGAGPGATTPVPVPAAVWSGLSLLGGLGLVGRVKRSRAARQG